MDKNRLIMVYEKDFQFIIKVVSSCQNNQQLLTARTLFENFKKKWIKQLPKMEMIGYMYRFESTYLNKKVRL